MSMNYDSLALSSVARTSIVISSLVPVSENGMTSTQTESTVFSSPEDVADTKLYAGTTD